MELTDAYQTETNKIESFNSKTNLTYLTHVFSFSDSEDEILCLKFSKDNQKLAGAGGDGKIRLLDIDSLKISELEANPKVNKFDEMPITGLRWRSHNNKSNVLVASSADGFIYYWHVKSQKLVHTLSEPENQIYCIDYDRNYEVLASGGKDFKIRLYDESTKSVKSVLESSYDNNKGHSNRIFALKFHPENSNLLFSGGWDKTVYLWDGREERPKTHFLGPSVSGESIDIKGDHLLAGSFNDTQNLSIFDIRKPKEPIEIDWFSGDKDSTSQSVPSGIYSAMYSKLNQKYILAGGASKNEFRVFHSSKDKNYEGVGKITGLPTPLQTIDGSSDGRNFVFGLADGSVHGVKINKKKR